MIIELAIATQTSPAHWWHEDAATIATAVEILNMQAAKAKGGRHGK